MGGFRSEPIPEQPPVLGEYGVRRPSGVYLFAHNLTDFDSVAPGNTGDLTTVYVRRPDGLIVRVSDAFPYSTKMRHITSATYPHGDPDEPPFGNSWLNYSFDHCLAAFTRDFLGCVWVQGMIKSGSIGATAFVMPEGYWNTGGHLRWAAIANSAFGVLDYRQVGQVYPTVGSNTWFSLCRMAFPETNRITWHAVGGAGEPAFENSWVNYVASGWDTAAFAKDALGRVWIKGFVKDGANGTVFTLPVGYRPSKSIVMVTVSNTGVIAKLQVHSDGTVKMYLLGAGTNAWASINIVFMADGIADWLEIGVNGPAFENSWANFEGEWDTAAFYKDAAGIVHTKGFIKSGTIGGVPAFTLPVGYRPKQGLNFPALSNNAIGRIYLSEYGEVQPVIGNNTWYSVHCSFVAEQ